MYPGLFGRGVAKQSMWSLLKGIQMFTYLVIECGECRRRWRKLAIVAVNEENGRD